MKFKVDENLPVEVASDLPARGHGAQSVFDQLIAGINDESLLQVVAEEARVFLTMDKGIANIRVYPPKNFSGLVLFRPSDTGRGSVLAFVRRNLPKILDLDVAGRLIVVNHAGVRIR